jgi:hypothetical protein
MGSVNTSQWYGSSAWAAHNELPENFPARTPTSPKHLRSASVVLRHSPDKPSASAYASGFGGADAPATDAAPVSLAPQTGTILEKDLRRRASSARQLVLVANLPASAPVVRSGAPFSQTCDRTASVATGSATAGESRSHIPAAAPVAAVAGECSMGWPAAKLHERCREQRLIGELSFHAKTNCHLGRLRIGWRCVSCSYSSCSVA